MKRLRILFVLLALALLAPMALVVRRALGSLEAERVMHHRDVADRIADEMERELTAWLKVEEDRPFAQYRFFYVPETSPPQVIELVRSPLSELPTEPFLVCYFQIDPDGTVSTPLWPGNEELARAAGWQASPETRELAGLVTAAVGQFWSGRTLPSLDLDAPASEVFEQQATDLADVLQKKQAFGEEEKEEAPAASFLRSLNRGANERRQRPAKVAPSQAANVYNFSRDESNVVQDMIQSREGARDNKEPAAAADLWTMTEEVEEEIAKTLAAEASETIDVRLEPMVGRLATVGHLVLYRTVSIGEKAYRQGLVLDVRELLSWLTGRVLAQSELAAFAAIAPSGSGEAPAPNQYTFAHRFAEPFGAVAVDISLAALPGVRGAFDLYTLSLLLAAATIFGLLALYRMVAVRLAYAERRSNFVSAVTHELKTPLTAIRMYAEMLRDGMVPDEAKRQRYYEILTAESERLGRLVQNVLELSQLEKKKRAMRLVAGDLGSVLEEVVGVIGPHAEKEGFAVSLEIEPGLPEVRFDRDALLQVLFNLVDNALKYSRQAAEKEIALSCRRQGDGVVVAVADRGPGVARKHLQKIFEPFYRGEDELTRRSKGTGMGLALVRGLVEQMGGKVTGRNAHDGGFEIAISLAA